MTNLSKHFYYADQNSPEFSHTEMSQMRKEERQKLMDSAGTLNTTKIRHQVEIEEARQEVIEMFKPIKVERVKPVCTVGMWNFSRSIQ